LILFESPLFKARMAGVCQLLEALTAGFGEVIVPSWLVVSGNATATAANILGHERLFWLGFASRSSGLRSMPPLAHYLYPFIAAASALGEIPLELWLIVMGVNAQRWKEQATVA
jgi:Domain of unknown function (DUF4386)